MNACNRIFSPFLITYGWWCLSSQQQAKGSLFHISLHYLLLPCSIASNVWITFTDSFCLLLVTLHWWRVLLIVRSGFMTLTCRKQCRSSAVMLVGSSALPLLLTCHLCSGVQLKMAVSCKLHILLSFCCRWKNNEKII